MDRLLRLGGGMPGLNQGPPPSDAPVVDTAEQVFSHTNICIPFMYFLSLIVLFRILKGIYIILGTIKNA